MRVIGGKLKGRRLHSVKGFHVRPTTGRHRESIFNIIHHRLRNASVLDLFAGTGALGIEAMSRGATFAVFVDMYPNALSVIHKNVETCHLRPVTRVVRCNVLKNLKCLESYRFDLVLMDPPYHSGALIPALVNLQRCGCLNNEALVVIEHAFDEPLDQNMPCYKLVDQRRYGKTLVSFLNFVLMEPV